MVIILGVIPPIVNRKLEAPFCFYCDLRVLLGPLLKKKNVCCVKPCELRLGLRRE